MSRDERVIATVRVVVIVVVAVLATVAYLFARGPAVWQRLYHPLSHERAIEAAALRHKVNPFLVCAVVNAESGFDADEVSKAGAIGLMQVMPQTARELRQRGLVAETVVAGKELSDPEVNVEYGVAYLRYLIGRYHEVEVALAAYNAGLRNADVWAGAGGDIREAIDFPETRHFVLRVMRARERYEDLYPEAFPAWRENAR